MKFLAIIPARGGSKGIPRKNLRPFLGKPLISWSIRAAALSKSLDGFLVSTEDKEIAEVSKEFGAKVDVRPGHLATDEATTLAVIQDIAQRYRDVENFVILQPTSPLRNAGLIDECIQEYLHSQQASEGPSDNLVTGFYCKFREFGSHNNERRQDYKGFFYDDGNVYIIHRSVIESGRWSGDRILKKLISHEQNLEIDDEVDWIALEAVANHFGLGRGSR